MRCHRPGHTLGSRGVGAGAVRNSERMPPCRSPRTGPPQTVPSSAAQSLCSTLKARAEGQHPGPGQGAAWPGRMPESGPLGVLCPSCPTPPLAPDARLGQGGQERNLCQDNQGIEGPPPRRDPGARGRGPAWPQKKRSSGPEEQLAPGPARDTVRAAGAPDPSRKEREDSPGAAGG